MKILHLTLKKVWFDMIANGVKREEYREVKPYWRKRLEKKNDVVHFRNGYLPTSPVVTVELHEVLIGFGAVEWGAPKNQKVYILRLGNVLDYNEYN